MQEMWVQSLGWEDPLEKEMGTHSSILAWKIPWAEEPGGLQSTGSWKVKHHLVTEHTHTIYQGSAPENICKSRGKAGQRRGEFRFWPCPGQAPINLIPHRTLQAWVPLPKSPTLRLGGWPLISSELPLTWKTVNFQALLRFLVWAQWLQQPRLVLGRRGNSRALGEQELAEASPDQKDPGRAPTALPRRPVSRLIFLPSCPVLHFVSPDSNMLPLLRMRTLGSKIPTSENTEEFD